MNKKTINRIFLENVKRNPKKVIIKHKEEKGGKYVDVTWEGLNEMVTAFASGLMAMGFNPGDKLAILSFNRLEWIVSDLGTLFSGGVDVPIYHTNTPEQCQYIISDSGAMYIVVEDTDQLGKILSVKDDIKDLVKIILIEGEVPEDSGELITSFAEVMKEGRAISEKLSNELEGEDTVSKT